MDEGTRSWEAMLLSEDELRDIFWAPYISVEATRKINRHIQALTTLLAEARAEIERLRGLLREAATRCFVLDDNKGIEFCYACKWLIGEHAPDCPFYGVNE